jgi:hypothetical protein
MIGFDPTQRRRLVASARLLESDKEGERMAALEAIKRQLPASVTIADLVERALAVSPIRSIDPEPVEPVRSWQRMARDILDHHQALSVKEFRFVANLAGARSEPTEKQLNWLNDIAERLRVAA